MALHDKACNGGPSPFAMRRSVHPPSKLNANYNEAFKRLLLPLAQASTHGLKCVQINQNFSWLTGLAYHRLPPQVVDSKDFRARLAQR
jgi:hypothetical protein